MEKVEPSREETLKSKACTDLMSQLVRQSVRRTMPSQKTFNVLDLREEGKE